MGLGRELAVIFLGALAGAALGVYLAGPIGGIVGVLPPTAAALVIAWRAHQERRAMRAQLDTLWDRVDPQDDDFIAKLDALSSWPGDGRLRQ